MGSPEKILTKYDSDGNQCGLPDQRRSFNNKSRDFSEYELKYFTNIFETATGMKVGVSHYAVCVE